MLTAMRFAPTLGAALYLATLAAISPSQAMAQGTSLRFYNDQNVDPDLIQRVRIVIGADLQPSDLQSPLDLGDPVDSADGSFTIEFWLRANSADNPLGSGCGGYFPIEWIHCPIVIDRDINGSGEFGKFGLSVCNDGSIRAGFERQATGTGVLACSGATSSYDGDWHHIAFTRSGATGQACVYLDGVQRDCASGPAGAISYDDRRIPTSPSGQDPTITLAAEKHGFIWNGFTGWLDEVRFSDVVRYAPCGADATCFSAPDTPFQSDSSTVGLFHFDEQPAGSACSCAAALLPLSSAGTCVADSSTYARHAECRYGATGPNSGPVYSAETPFMSAVPALPSLGLGAIGLGVLCATIARLRTRRTH